LLTYCCRHLRGLVAATIVLVSAKYPYPEDIEGIDMSAAPIRVLMISDQETVHAISQAAAEISVKTEPHELKVSDQRFGLAEAAAIIGIFYTVTKVAELLVKIYKTLHGQRKITVKTPKGSVTIEGDASMTVEDLRKVIEEAGIL
jgi:hypothetical protein